jgi:hypothetical protein
MNSKEQMVGFLLFEMKGIIDTMSDTAEKEDEYYHPSLDRLRDRINHAIELLTSVGDCHSGEINFKK